MTEHDIAPRSPRETDMVLARAAGATLQEIGDAYGITRERVRQILARAGMDGFDSPFTTFNQSRQRLPGARRREQAAARKCRRRQQLETLCVLRQELGRTPSLGELAARCRTGTTSIQADWISRRKGGRGIGTRRLYRLAGMTPRSRGDWVDRPSRPRRAA